MVKFWSKRGTLPTDYSKVYLRFVYVCQKLVAAECNLGQFFVLGDCWFFVHLPSPKLVEIVLSDLRWGGAELVAAERNLCQFFVLGDGWFFIHGSLLKIKKWAVPGGNAPPFDQIYHPFLDAFV